ncbi:DUF6009 family protein [Streptomyces caelestis]|uniref:DUF6009 family protein n=1 Tax=Streptomyces caelestis TaxID=36816 RepID=UPI0035D9A314
MGSGRTVPALPRRERRPGRAGQSPRRGRAGHDAQVRPWNGYCARGGLYATSAPAEAVDPHPLEPRVKGSETERSEGGPPSLAMQELGIQLPL